MPYSHLVEFYRKSSLAPCARFVFTTSAEWCQTQSLFCFIRNTKLSGANPFSLTCSSRATLSRTELNIEFHMLNVTISGNYNITGLIAGEMPVLSTGEFSIRSEAGGIYQFSPAFRNVNGHLQLDWTFASGFAIMADTFRTSFPGLLDGIELQPEVATTIVDSLGYLVFCPPQTSCSIQSIGQSMLQVFELHLQEIFAVNRFCFDG